MATDEPVEPKPSARPEPWQWGLLACPIVVLAGHVALLWFQKPDYVALLWQFRMGVKMLVAAGALLVIGSAVYLGGCALLNRRARVPWGTRATVAQVALLAVWIVCCALVAFIVTVGPAAIQIQNNLLKG